MSDFLVHGLRHWDAADLCIRASVGVFFAISGYHKLFNKDRHATLVETFKKDGIPCIRFNQWFVPIVEFTAGIWFTLGLLTVISAGLLGAICLVATCTDGVKRIRDWKPEAQARLNELQGHVVFKKATDVAQERGVA